LYVFVSFFSRSLVAVVISRLFMTVKQGNLCRILLYRDM
jgi:hypothetical protein